ncbi:MAG: hypothetical protein EB067_05225 [Actinobacteria bacterium]|nr:hypothetical protein [Actinomycetota bacterium]
MAFFGNFIKGFATTTLPSAVITEKESTHAVSGLAAQFPIPPSIRIDCQFLSAEQAGSSTEVHNISSRFPSLRVFSTLT